MPLYEYQCVDHGRFEVIRKFADAPLTACPTCGKVIEKLPSAPAIQFKGTGWYITDYARKSSGGDGEGKAGDAGAKADASSKDGGSSKDTGSSRDAGGSKDTGSSKDTSSSTPTKSTSKDSSATGSSPTK